MNWSRIGKIICEAIGFALDDIKVIAAKCIAVLFGIWFVTFVVSIVFAILLVIEVFIPGGKPLPDELWIGPYYLAAHAVGFGIWWIWHCFYRANKRLR